MEATPKFAGIDWSWQHHAICIVDQDGQRVAQEQVPHSGPGLESITRLFVRHGVRRVAIERGDGPLAEHLLAAGVEVVVISPRQVGSLRLRYGTAGNKDDHFDAFVLADALRTDGGRWRVVAPDSPETLALRTLVRARTDLVRHRIAVANQLLAVLRHSFPGAVGLFHQLDIPISLAFLRRFPSQEKATWLSERRMSHWLQANGYCGRHTARQMVDHLDDATRGHVGDAAAAANERVVLTLVELLTTLRAQIKELEVSIREALLAHRDGPIFTSLPRAGTVRAATLLAELGDCRARFPDDTALAAAAGVAPSTRQSGKYLSVTFRRGCNRELRHAVIDWAQDTPRANAWAAQKYQGARDRGCNHPHASRILARAWIRVLWRCWIDEVPYDPAIHGGMNNLLHEAA
jgi:transposase